MPGLKSASIGMGSAAGRVTPTQHRGELAGIQGHGDLHSGCRAVKLRVNATCARNEIRLYAQVLNGVLALDRGYLAPARV
jgi:hypothetical protein